MKKDTKHRGTLTILNKICSTINNTDDCIFSVLCRKTNLTWNAARNYIDNLTDAGIVYSTKMKERTMNHGEIETDVTIYKLTEKGIKFLRKLEDILLMVNNVKSF